MIDYVKRSVIDTMIDYVKAGRVTAAAVHADGAIRYDLTTPGGAPVPAPTGERRRVRPDHDGVVRLRQGETARLTHGVWR